MHCGVIRTKPAITHSPMVHTSRALFDKSAANKVRFGMMDSVFGELKTSLERSSIVHRLEKLCEKKIFVEDD